MMFLVDCAIEDSEFIYDLYYSHANNLDELCDMYVL